MRLSTITFLTVGAALCWGQDVIVNGNSTQSSVLKSTNTSTASADRPGLWGVSKPVANYGIGVKGEGGYVGLYGIGSYSGTGTRMGVYGSGSGGTNNYGVYGIAQSTGSYSFGGYFSAGGATNNWAGYFSGNVYVSGTVTQASDEQLKTNIQALDATTLDKLLSLNPKTYNMAADKFPAMNFSTGTQYGLLAQDVQKAFPDLVSEVPAPDNNSDGNRSQPNKTYKSVNYTGLIPVLIKAMQQQQDQIDELKDQVRKLKAGGNNGNGNGK